MNNFPNKPNHGDLFEYKPGLVFQYDISVNSWLPLMVNNLGLELATVVKSGAMSHIDLVKLNRLILPLPQSTITSDNCDIVYESGTVDLTSSDQFVNVDGNVKIRNLDEFGDDIETVQPYHIHQHTYGFDFRLELSNLIEELIDRSQVTLKGTTGPKGDTGEKGDNGLSFVMAGPKGYKGEAGDILECNVQIESEPIPMDPIYKLSKAFVKARIKDHPTDNRKYRLELDRQSVGLANRAATQFNVQDFSSYWVLAVRSTVGTPQSLFHMDVEPIIESIHDKFLQQIDLLKMGYENVVRHWIQTMSDLFDEQKTALCCALENCISKTKNSEERRHMEAVAASAHPEAKVKIHKYGQGTNNQKIPGTRRTRGNDCANTNQSLQNLPQLVADHNSNIILLVDAITHITNKKNALKIDLEPGKYHAIINDIDTKINGYYGSPVKIEYVDNNKRKTISFLDKGKYNQLKDAQAAYVGLALSFDHDGGEVLAYLPNTAVSEASGRVAIELVKIDRDVKYHSANDPSYIISGQKQEDYFLCKLKESDIKLYIDNYSKRRGTAVLVEVGGQDYIILKRDLNVPCINSFKNKYGKIPAVAFLTLDGKNLLRVVNHEYSYNINFSMAVMNKIDQGKFKTLYGDEQRIKHILFPTVSK